MPVCDSENGRWSQHQVYFLGGPLGTQATFALCMGNIACNVLTSGVEDSFGYTDRHSFSLALSAKNPFLLALT